MSKEEIRVGFDMDGVIIDHTESKMVMTKLFDMKIKEKDTPSQVIKKILPKDIWANLESMLFYDPQYAFISKPMDGVIHTLETLQKKSIPIFLISRRKNSAVAIDFLKFKKLWPKFFNEKNTAFVLDPSEKNAHAKTFKLTHYIDDELDVLKTLTNVQNRFLFDQYDIFTDDPSYIRLTSWNNFEENLK